MSKRQSSLMFIVSLVISGMIFLQMGLYIISIVAGWNAKFNLVVVCHSWLRSIGLSSLEYALDALVIYTLSFSLWKIGSQIVHAARMKNRFEQYRERKLTIELNRAYGSGKEDFIVVSHPAPIAITMGFVWPKIIVSTGLMNLLDEGELKAVMTHEKYHQENRDPLKLFLLSLCALTMWYIPILKWFNQKYRIIQEVLADEFAIEKQRTSVNLASALLKMLKVGKPEKMSFIYASFADTSVNYRIQHILNPVKGVQLELPLKVTLISLTIFSLLCVLFIYALA
ncbi:MAG: M56 family metallopeptidase [Sporosarcina sp.]